MYEHWSDYLAVGWDYIFGPVTILANIVLLSIILKHTPESTKTYATIIALMTTSDIIGASSNVMAASRVIPMDPQFYLIFRGPCRLLFGNNLLLRAQMCTLGYILEIETYMLNHSVLILSYAYRSLAILQPLRVFHRKWVYLILAVYTLVHFTYLNTAYYLALEPMSVVDASFMLFRPEIVGSNMTYYAIVDQKAPFQLVFYYASRHVPWIVILVAVLCRWRVERYLTSFTFSENTRELQKSIGNIFLAQTTHPILSAVMTIFYLINSQAILSNEWAVILENFMAKPVYIIYILNPIVTIYFVAPYRRAFSKMIGTDLSNARNLIAVQNISSNMVS